MIGNMLRKRRVGGYDPADRSPTPIAPGTTIDGQPVTLRTPDGKPWLGQSSFSSFNDWMENGPRAGGIGPGAVFAVKGRDGIVRSPSLGSPGGLQNLPAAPSRPSTLQNLPYFPGQSQQQPEMTLLSAPAGPASAYQHLPGAAEMNAVDEQLSRMPRRLQEQQFQRDARRIDAEYGMAVRNQQGRARASRMTGSGQLPMGVNGTSPDGQPMASIPPQRGVYDPGYGQYQQLPPSPQGGVPGGGPLGAPPVRAPQLAPTEINPGYGQNSYQNSQFQQGPKNEYGLRRSPSDGLRRSQGDANLAPMDEDGNPIFSPPKVGPLGTYGIVGKDSEGNIITKGPNRGATLYRDADGRHRVVGNVPQDVQAAQRQARIERGKGLRQSFLAKREATIAERQNRRLGIKQPIGLLGPSPLIGGSSQNARPPGTPKPVDEAVKDLGKRDKNAWGMIGADVTSDPSVIAGKLDTPAYRGMSPELQAKIQADVENIIAADPEMDPIQAQELRDLAKGDKDARKKARKSRDTRYWNHMPNQDYSGGFVID